MVIETARLDSPIGGVRLAVHGERLCALGFAEHWPRLEHALRRRFVGLELRTSDDPAGVVTRLRAYFAGDVSALDSIAVDLGGTEFQRRVWSKLREIPCGRTLSYRDLASAIGAPSAVRAVGAANGANPVSIVVPCHRVIGANGDLVGYGGGIERKSWLLTHEGARLLP
ncbi:MAG: methylated-DNA--[protein]-cysteine S-methyltransferase [Candidatus Binatia bacterium]|jgi:methylated-DNA-[protein]-cysteine S-methyltransferase